jgi:hypothetical protein
MIQLTKKKNSAQAGEITIPWPQQAKGHEQSICAD